MCYVLSGILKDRNTDPVEIETCKLLLPRAIMATNETYNLTIISIQVFLRDIFSQSFSPSTFFTYFWLRVRVISSILIAVIISIEREASAFFFLALA